MLESLYIAATGMHTQQMQLDSTANNLANVNTTSYKKSRISFEDLMYRELSATHPTTGEGGTLLPFGVGAGIASSDKVFTQGDLKKTEQPLDVAIQGSGFFEVTLPDGTSAFTRSGALRLDRDGMLSTQDGYPLNPAIQVPSDAQGVLINPDGIVYADIPGESSPMEIGRIEIATFSNPGGLHPNGDNLYLSTHESGDVIYAAPGQDGAGTISQGYLESSNISLIEELTTLMTTQRAYEINAKVIQASDDVMGIINNLRR
jgi:flagellar basal-body rod protein FlgG